MAKFTIVFTANFLVLMLDGGAIRSSEEAPVDAYGDVLPQGATARFGSLRWRIPGAIEAVAVSPNGKLVAAVNMHGKVAVWEKENGRLLHEIFGSESGAASLAFSPDGKYLATGGAPDYKNGAGDFHIRIWDLKTGKLKTQFPPVNGSPISRLIFTSDNSKLISAGLGQPVTIWKSPSGEKIREFPNDKGTYHDVALSPAEKWLAVVDRDLERLTVYSFDGSRKLSRFASKKNGHFGRVELSADGRSLLTYQQTGLRSWDVATGKLKSTIPLKSDKILRDARFAPDGKKIALFHLDTDVHWLDAATGDPLDSWKGSFNEVRALTFSRDGKTVVTGDWGVVRVWDTSTGKVVQQPTGPNTISYSLCFSADGKTILAASVDCLYFLDGQTLKERVRVPVTLDRFYSAALSPDGQIAAFARRKDEIVLVDSRDPNAFRTLRHPGWIPDSLAFSPDGKHLYAAAPKSAGLRVWNIQTGKETAPLDADVLPLSNLSLASNAGKLALLVKGAKPLCRLWDLRTGKEEQAFALDNGPVRYNPDQILLSDDGNLLLTCHVHSLISVWDVSRRVKRHEFKFTFEDGPFCWEFSKDSKLLVTTHGKGTIRTWDMASGKMVAEVHGHPSGIVALACSPDGGLISTCTSCTILRWQKTAWQEK